jgi:type IV pilus assembly protein PilV
MNVDVSMPRQRNYHFPSRAAGVGLIEVLIAVLVMAIGMLGIAAMQATALRNSQSSLERSQAVIQSYAILDAMRANLTAARSGAYNLPRTCDAPAAGGTLASNDLAEWIGSLDERLNASACGQIVCEAAGGAAGAQNCTVTVEWNDERGTAGEEGYTVETESRI